MKSSRMHSWEKSGSAVHPYKCSKCGVASGTDKAAKPCPKGVKQK